jgi:hypothetical protein
MNFSLPSSSAIFLTISSFSLSFSAFVFSPLLRTGMSSSSSSMKLFFFGLGSASSWASSARGSGL